MDELVLRKKSYPLSRSIETPNSTGYKYIHYGDIHTRVADIININSKLPNINSGNYELLNEGDLVLADASEDYQGIAMPSLLAFTPEYKLVAGLHTIVLRPKKEKVDPMFLYYLIKSPIFRKYGYRIGTGMKVFGISITNVLKFESLFPNLKEQQKISSFLNSLDSALALHQLRESKLKKLKKAYIQKLFPITENESPVIRFKEFNYNWDLCKLQEISNITMGQSPKGETYTNNPEEHILIQGNADMKNRKVVPRVWTSQVTKSANPGDIILSVRAPVGEVGITDYEVVLGRGVASLTGNEFLFQSLLRMKETGYWTKYSTGSTFESINSADLKNAEIYQPHMDEQIQIGELLETFDNLIGLQADKVNKLKDLKKGYLQKSFL